MLADTALRAKDLDEAAALAAKQRAEDALRGATDKLEQAEALKELVRMNEQIKMIQKLRKVEVVADPAAGLALPRVPSIDPRRE